MVDVRTNCPICCGFVPPSPPSPPGPPQPPLPPRPPPLPLQVSAMPKPGVHADYVRDLLNVRYQNGHATNDLREAGVLIHTFDGHLSSEEPWRVASEGWMSDYSHILSTSLVNAGKAGLFNSNGGVVLSPASRIICSYPYECVCPQTCSPLREAADTQDCP